jgi:hypothetical protein
MSPATQHDLFCQAIALLGGKRVAAAALDVSERTIYRLMDGTIPISQALQRKMHEALVAHGEAARQLARALDPLFAANRVRGRK